MKIDIKTPYLVTLAIVVVLGGAALYFTRSTAEPSINGAKPMINDNASTAQAPKTVVCTRCNGTGRETVAMCPTHHVPWDEHNFGNCPVKGCCKSESGDGHPTCSSCNGTGRLEVQ